MVMLAERALPGSFIVDQTGCRFVNEATDYMSFGQRVLEREKAGDPAESMWFVFDQEYRNSYVFAGGIFPRQPRSEEHTSELQSLMRISSAVFCLKKKKKENRTPDNQQYDA